MLCTLALQLNSLLYGWKFSPGENFYQFHHLLLLAKILSMNIFSGVDDCIEDMVTFTLLAKILSANYSCNIEVHVAGLVNFSPTRL